MKLSLGITELTPGWAILLQQIGIPYVISSEGAAYKEFPVVVLSSMTEQKTILDYIEEGGCLITEADIAREVLNIRTKKIYVKFVHTKPNEIFRIGDICDICRNCLVPADANQLPDQTGRNTTLSVQMGKGKAIIFPSGFTSLLTNSTIVRKNFFSEYSSKETNERVTCVSKGMIYHYIKNALEHLYHFRGLPFVNLWQFPDGEKNVFLYRVDTDFASREQINELYNVFQKNNIKGTWFVETQSLEKQPRIYENFVDQEISLHCYRHRNFRSYEKNLWNIKKGIEILSSLGMNPRGFAAPYGEWNQNLGQAIDSSDFQYSSEFGYAYDCLPAFPYIGSKLSTTLQVPIHPMSIGRLKWGGHDDEGILKYFLNIADEKIFSHEPIILYTHPGEQKFNLLERIFQKINSLNIKSLTFKEFSDWWKERISFNWNAGYVDNEIKLAYENENYKAWIRVCLPGRETFIAPVNDLKKKIKIDDACLQKDYKVPMENLRTKSFRMMKHDVLFKYRKWKQ